MEAKSTDIYRKPQLRGVGPIGGQEHKSDHSGIRIADQVRLGSVVEVDEAAGEDEFSQ